MPQDWASWRERILYQLNEQSGAIKGIQETMVRIEKDLAGLKVRSSLWGGVAGALAGVAAGLSHLL